MEFTTCFYFVFVYFITLIYENDAYFGNSEFERPFDFSSFEHTPDSKIKVDKLGAVLKRHINEIRQTKNKQVDIIFLVDSSASVGRRNFADEIKFVRKLLADFTVDYNHTRVSVITFSSRTKVKKQIDYIGDPNVNNHKCSLMENDEMLRQSRPNSKRYVFLVTDGFSNGGDPRPEAENLRNAGVKIFTIGIRNGNIRELRDMASEPKNETCYILDSFEEFEQLARRALHEDLHGGSYIPQSSDRCNNLCSEGRNCCDDLARCKCGTYSGQYECVCPAGYYGSGLRRGGCRPCPSGTYKPQSRPGDVSSCSPCPDENQVTNLGEISYTACQCKKGFRIFNETGCAALTCPALTPPKSGYFVNDKCSNVFNAACGIKCRPGYELRGSSLRICQEDGTWSGKETECIMKTCPALPKPKNGNMICDRDDFTFSTECRFTCDTGYKLVGSRKRECLAIAYWTGITTRCREITCQPLPEVRDGHVIPAMCSRGEVSFGTTCEIDCYLGYSLVGPQRKQCTPEGMWTPDTNGKMSTCKDTTPPFFILCPPDLEIVCDDDDNTAEAQWEKPVAVDNSGVLPIITVNPAVEPPSRFPIGSNLVKYTARDSENNTAVCSFNIVVLDKTNPAIDRCFSPLPVVSPEMYGNVTWDEPEFSDNSGVDLRIEKTHAPGLFMRGKTLVTYTAFDESGNNNTCVISVNVIPHPCEYPPRPVHGTRDCYETTEGVHCSIACNEGYAFVVQPAEDYFCAFDNVWRPENKMPIPDCAVEAPPEGVIQPASITYLAPIKCSNQILLSEFEASFERKLSLRVEELCEGSLSCQIQNLRTICEEQDDLNTLRVVLSRKRRDVVNTFTRNKRAPLRNENELASSKKIHTSSITFEFSIKVKCPVGTFFNVMTETCESCITGTYQPKEGMLTCLVCPTNTSTPKNNSKSNDECKEPCITCPLDQYQTKYGQTTCLNCSAGMATARRGTRRVEKCKRKCVPGFVSKTGLRPCLPCPKGYYQPEDGQSACFKCPGGGKTVTTGSARLQDCEGDWEEMQADLGGDGFETQQLEVNECFADQCLNGGINCETDINECEANPCLNNGSCIDQVGDYECRCHLGFTGKKCDVNIDDCNPNPCLNDGEKTARRIINHCILHPCLNSGSCENTLGGYNCACVTGYAGINCEIDIDECEEAPCVNNATCHDEIGSYRCSCLTGFTGNKCETNINECESSPCADGASCVDEVGRFRCVCPPGFSGIFCENELNSHYQLDFPSSGTLEYSKIPMESSLTALTASFWMKSSDDLNQGTPFSYASSNEMDNAFTITDYSGFVIYVNNQKISTDVIANDGRWHHIAFTWSSNRGTWRIYMDGVLEDSGYDFATGETIQGGGTFVVGQEQDPGGTFSSNEAFIGKIAHLNIWDHQLRVSDINDMRLSCRKQLGNVLAWTDIQAGLHGELRADPSSFCRECPVPVKPEYGNITYDGVLAGSTVNYNCIRGYAIVGNPSRQCLVTGEWEGEAAACRIRNCGPPRYIDNGYFNRGNFEYDSRIRYNCYKGYKIEGSKTIYCNADGIWEGTTPRCVESTCKLPILSENTIVIGTRKTSYTPGETVEFTCTSGNSLLTDYDNILCQTDGSWDRDAPTCDLDKCTSPPVIDNGGGKETDDRTEYSIGSTFTYECNYGYKLSETGTNPTGTIHCLNAGEWEDNLPLCEKISCPIPPNVPNAVSQYDSTEFLNTCYIRM
ncbi:hypothetical protein KUTeg_016207 [Tegillarca granosa]|uniref:Sushi, von Willebrand factor type A, EGF and pentraxin domain-containing protein 1 n=1 Tax=Tegillarca granosa TaxID=220873 RepID=A0ABQ9EK72_TEGGR|nr:hypothetical protein KUTeg_016207 [Tegillarca granosa]